MLENVGARRPNTQRQRNHQRPEGSNQYQCEGNHGVIPLVHSYDEHQPDHRAEHELPSAGQQRDDRDHADNNREVWGA